MIYKIGKYQVEIKNELEYNPDSKKDLSEYEKKFYLNLTTNYRLN